MNDIAFLEQLIRYQDGVLTPEEVAALEEEMLASPEKRRQFAELQMRSVSVYEHLRQRAYRKSEQSLPASWLGALWGHPVMVTAGGLILVAAFVAMWLLPQPSAAAATLRHALEVHRAALDRCYRLQVKLDPVFQETSPLPAKVDSRLWTRGDRFWVESLNGEQTVAWGREAKGDVWFALSPELGVRLDADEVGERLALHCELKSLQVESLLRSVLADFDLRREPGSAGSELIHARLKPGRSHPHYRAALLEVDTQSGVLRRVVLDRIQGGRPAATVTFTLTETSLQPEASYTLAGHLTAQATVYDRQHEPGKRRALLTQFFNAIRSSGDRP